LALAIDPSLRRARDLAHDPIEQLLAARAAPASRAARQGRRARPRLDLRVPSRGATRIGDREVITVAVVIQDVLSPGAQRVSCQPPEPSHTDALPPAAAGQSSHL